MCRSNLSVAAPRLLAEFGGRGLDKAALGLISSAGVLAYAAGKLVNGAAADVIGGRRMFLAGMIGSIAATLAFGASAGFAAFVAAWTINRFAQSMGWGALVKIASHWYAPERYGAVMGVLSLSFLFGDAAGRVWLGALVSHGAGWRAVFIASAATLAAIAIVCAVTLRESPRSVGVDEPPVSARNVYGSRGNASRPAGLRDLLAPYVRNPAFWLVCLVSLGLTLIRESFNAWTPTYLVIGPYSLLAGAIAVDFGGRRGSATAAGLIDTAGYLGALASGVVVGSVAQHLGWSVVFRLQAAVAAASMIACWCQTRVGVEPDTCLTQVGVESDSSQTCVRLVTIDDKEHAHAD